MGPSSDASPPLRTPHAELEELLRHAGWLRGLAASLVGDAGRADDLVQDTWLAALRRPPRAGAAPRAWLGRVLRNLARNRRRDEGTRAEHERRAAAPSPRPSPQAIAEEVEAHRLLAEAVGRLVDPGRTIVVLRYFRGLDSAAIGHALALPAGTVRWKLQEALEELRRELDRRCAGGRRAWSLLLARLLAAPGPAAAVPWATLAAAGLLALGFGWWSLRADRAEPRVSTPELVASPRTAVHEVPELLVPAAPVDAPAREAERVDRKPVPLRSSRPERPEIEGRVLVDGVEPGHPIGVRVQFRTQLGTLPGEIVARTDVRKLVTDDSGRFDLFAEPGNTFGLRVPGFVLEPDQPAEWETPARDIVLRLRTAPALRGRVVTAAGDPVPGATGLRWLRGSASGSEIVLERGELLCDPEARFEIPLTELVNQGPAEECEATILLEVPHVGRRLVETGSVPLADRDLGEIRLEPVWVLRFRVRDASGAPLGGAVARLDDHWLSKPSSPTNRDGFGELRHAPERGVRVRFSALGFVDQVLPVGVGEEPEVWLAAATVLEVQLEPPANHNGPFPALVVSAREPFLGHAEVQRHPVDLDRDWIQTELGATRVRAHGQSSDRGAFEAVYVPDAGGRVRIVGLAPGIPLGLEARDRAGRALGSAEVALGPAETKRVELRYEERE